MLTKIIIMLSSNIINMKYEHDVYYSVYYTYMNIKTQIELMVW